MINDELMDELTVLLDPIFHVEKTSREDLLVFWSKFATIIKSYYDKSMIALTEYNNQVCDLEHSIANRDNHSTEEEIMEYQKLLRETLNDRTNINDINSILKIVSEDCIQIRNFIGGMSKRKYTPRSERFKLAQSGNEKTKVIHYTKQENENQMNQTSVNHSKNLNQSNSFQNVPKNN